MFVYTDPLKTTQNLLCHIYLQIHINLSIKTEMLSLPTWACAHLIWTCLSEPVTGGQLKDCFLMSSSNLIAGTSRLYPDWFLIVWTEKKAHDIRFLQNRSKPHLEVVWNPIQNQFLQICLQSARSGHSDWTSKFLSHHSKDIGGLNGVSWHTSWALSATEPDKSPAAHLKICTPPLIIKHPKDDMLPLVTA